MWRTGDPRQEEKTEQREGEGKRKASYGFKGHIMERRLALL